MIDRYTHPEMGNIWTLENEFRTMLKVEILACEAMNKLGIVPDEALKDIQTKADFRLDRIKEIEATPAKRAAPPWSARTARPAWSPRSSRPPGPRRQPRTRR